MIVNYRKLPAFMAVLSGMTPTDLLAFAVL